MVLQQFYCILCISTALKKYHTNFKTSHHSPPELYISGKNIKKLAGKETHETRIKNVWITCGGKNPNFERRGEKLKKKTSTRARRDKKVKIGLKKGSLPLLVVVVSEALPVYIWVTYEKRMSRQYSVMYVQVCFVGRLSGKRDAASFHEVVSFQINSVGPEIGFFRTYQVHRGNTREHNIYLVQND